jgi:hypothetical protein
MTKLRGWITALLMASTVSVFSMTNDKLILNQAVALYHQSNYDSALLRLQGLQSKGPWKRRDSLSLFQYLGMAAAKVGNDSASLGYFSRLLQIDSLFQFPKNEDAVILKTFSQAQELRVSTPNLFQANRPKPNQEFNFRSKDLDSSVAAHNSTLDFNVPVKTSLNLSPMETSPAKNIPQPPKIGLAYGALPLGMGWMVKNRMKTGLALAALQASGLLISVYASEMQSREQGDSWGTQNEREKALTEKYQWIQRISLSTAMGAYLFSLIASAGD